MRKKDRRCNSAAPSVMMLINDERRIGFLFFLGWDGLNCAAPTFLAFSGTGNAGFREFNGRRGIFCHTWKTSVLVQLAL